MSTTAVPNFMIDPQPAANTEVVKNTGSETIAGVKTFTSPMKLNTVNWLGGSSLLISNPNIHKGTAPSENQYTNIGMYGADCSEWYHRIGLFETQYTPSGTIYTRMSAIKPSSVSETASASIEVGITSEGTISTWCPTPATSSNNNNIATTAFVNNRLSDIESKLNYIGTTTDIEGETASADKLGLVVNPTSTSTEGGQIVLRRGNSNYYNTIIDIVSNDFRVFQNGASNGKMFKISFADNATAGYIGNYLIDTVVEKSIGNSGYIRYYNGLQLIWGVVDIAAASTGTAVTFTKAFSSEPRIFLNTAWANAYGYSYGLQAVSRSSTGFTAVCGSGSADTSTTRWSSGKCVWLAIGNWK